MSKKLITLGATALLVACSSTPRPTVPDGSSRKPVNSDARVSQYRERTGEEQAAAADRSALTRQVAFLQGEIQQLKMYVIQLSTIATSNDSGSAKTAPPSAAAIQAPARPLTDRKPDGAATGADVESFEIRTGAVVFRVMQPYAKAEFSPSASFQGELLQLARESSRVDIRGRTDARIDNAADRSIAQRRALCAQAFLLSNGIPADKIHLSYMAAGDRLASNATPQGRAVNRRVEIETLGVDTHRFLDGAGGSPTGRGDVMGSM